MAELAAYEAVIIAALLLLVLIMNTSHQTRMKEKDELSHKERMYLWEQAERERNQLLNRGMAKDLNDYRQQVAVEAQAKTDTEVKMRENLLDQTYGPEWREMV